MCATDVAHPFVSGRADPDVAPVIGALAETALAFIDKGKDFSPLKTYLLFTLVDQKGIPELLAGTDAELREGDIFEAYVTKTTSVLLDVDSPSLMKKP